MLVYIHSQAFESFVRRCPKEVSPHINSIIGICLKFLCYDPNYNYEDDENDDAMDVGDDDEEQDSEGIWDRDGLNPLGSMELFVE